MSGIRFTDEFKRDAVAQVGARLCAVEIACAMLHYEGRRPFAYWWSVSGQNPVKNVAHGVMRT